jgi:soluble lytic murein transglycosylase-like protein
MKLPARAAQWLAFVEQAIAHEWDPPSNGQDLDVALVLAVVERESRCGDALTPKGPGGTGDLGHGHGLGQFDDRPPKPGTYDSDVFRDAEGLGNWEWVALAKPDGAPRWADPELNLARVVEQLRWNLVTFCGDIPAALAAYNASVARVRRVFNGLCAQASVSARAAAFDELTTGHDYVSWVLRTRDTFLGT